MKITTEQIVKCESDIELFDLLSSSMAEIMNGFDTDNLDEYITKIKSLPKVYWAFGAIYDLDVNITLDDLGWHFRNRYSKALAKETLDALKMLGAKEEAVIFEESMIEIESHWEELGRVLQDDRGDEFSDWYETSGLERKFDGLNKRFWALTTDSDRSLLDYLPAYARRNPSDAVL